MVLNKVNFLFLIFTFSYSTQSYSQQPQIAAEYITEDGNLKGDNETQASDNRNHGLHSRMMMGDTLYYQAELINYPNQGFGGADVSATTGATFGYTSSTSSGFYLSEDFTVPPGELWVIDSVVFFAYQTNSTTTSTFNVLRFQIMQGTTPGAGTIVFGDLTTNRLAATQFTGIYRTLPSAKTNTQRPIMQISGNLPSLNLTSGNYRIDYMLGGTLAAGPFVPQRTISTIHEATGNAYQFTTGWVALTELDPDGNNPLPKGMPFLIYGTSLEDKEAKVNGINYNTLQEAIDAASIDGDEITLLKNINSGTINIGLNGKSVIIKSNGFSCTINQLNIANGEYLRWTEGNLNISGTINNNTSGILWNNANITNANFVNTGLYKGNGSFTGTVTNMQRISPGN